MPALSRETPSALVCTVRDLRVAIDLAYVVEIMRPLPIRPLTAMPAFVVGVAIVRGVTTVVVDGGTLLVDPGTRAWTRFVALRTPGGPIALAVEGVVGVRTLDALGMRELPPLLSVVHADTVAAIGVRERELLVVLDAARIVPASTWAAIHEAEARA